MLCTSSVFLAAGWKSPQIWGLMHLSPVARVSCGLWVLVVSQYCVFQHHSPTVWHKGFNNQLQQCHQCLAAGTSCQTGTPWNPRRSNNFNINFDLDFVISTESKGTRWPPALELLDLLLQAQESLHLRCERVVKNVKKVTGRTASDSSDSWCHISSDSLAKSFCGLGELRCFRGVEQRTSRISFLFVKLRRWGREAKGGKEERK